MSSDDVDVGVYQYASGRWRAVWRVDDKIMHIGMYDTREEALHARKHYMRTMWKQYREALNNEQ